MMPREIFAIDPGLRAIGWAHVLLRDEGPALSSCGLARGELSGRGPVAWRAVVRDLVIARPPLGPHSRVVSEFPQVYAAGKSKGDPADLLELAAVVGAVARAFDMPMEIVLPRAWKGQIPKAVHARRILGALSHGCAAVFARDVARVPPYLQHNVIDAVGIAMWAAKRAGR